jgi:type IV pilus assembly protein PilE
MKYLVFQKYGLLNKMVINMKLKTKIKAYQGFTLIELMITVAIIGILTSLAYPSYLDQVRKTRRANAQSDLVELASYMERYYTQNYKYIGAALPFEESPKQGSTKYYALSVVSTSTPAGYTITATPKNGQDADSCGTMTVTHTGAYSAALTTCW